MPAKTPQPKPSPCVCMNVRRASRAITRIYDQALETSGLKVTQFSLLMQIDAHGPLNVSALARLMTLDRTTLVRNLKLLENAGFIENTPTDDPRERKIGITDHGRRTILESLPHWKNVQRLIRKHVDQDSLHALNRVLTVLETLADAGGEATA